MGPLCLWQCLLTNFASSGSPRLRYHFQNYKGAEFQQTPFSARPKPFQFHPSNANAFKNQQHAIPTSVGYGQHRSPSAYQVQYQLQQPYGRSYNRFPCRNLVLRRLRYRPCQYQAYSQQQRAYPVKYQNLAPARHYARTGYQAQWQQYQPRQAFYQKTHLPEVGSGYLQNHRSALTSDKFFLTQEGFWKPDGRPATQLTLGREVGANKMDGEAGRVGDREEKRRSEETKEERQRNQEETRRRLETEKQRQKKKFRIKTQLTC